MKFTSQPTENNIHTETALLRLQNDIFHSLDRSESTVLVMLDLSAAFDTIDHNTLLDRLEWKTVQTTAHDV